MFEVDDAACTVDDMEVRGKGGTRVQGLLGGARPGVNSETTR
jgi:hypothetical protein